MKALHLLLCAGFLAPVVTPSAEAQTIRINMRHEKKDVALDWLVDDELFSMTPDDFEKKAGTNHFVWQDKERTRARFNPDKFQYKVKDKDVGEVLVNFKGGKIASATISVLNKGDEDEIITQSMFSTGVSNVKALLSAASGVKEEARRKEELLSPKSEGAVWRSKKALYIGEWLFLPQKREEIDGWIWTIKAHGEFVRIRIMPPQLQLGVQLSKVRTTQTRPLLQAKVKRDTSNGDVIIQGIPMVDQGSKGYCAVASFERVLRHYGADVDMHDLANVAETYGGTNPQKMKTAILRMAQKLSLKTREILFLKQKQFEILFKNYNAFAKKQGKSELDLREVAQGYIDWKEVDPQTLKDFRKTTPEFAIFKRELVANIDKGIPILWALELGMYWEDRIDESFEANRYAVNKDTSDESKKDEKEAKEEAEDKKKEFEEMKKKNQRPPAYMMGGHMRLIVGYNAKYQTIFYTDSWGPGHELKSMPLDQAWATTLAMWSLEPN